MAVLAPCLGNLFDELNIRWPHRDHRTDGWIGDAAHQARESDHNPDSRGIVHAIDIDKDGLDPNVVISAAARDDRPTAYVIYNRWIYRRSSNWDARPYNGENPHTDHLHVSIQYGTNWEGGNWHWGISVAPTGADLIVPTGGAEEMTDWHAYIDRAAAEFASGATALDQGSALIRSITQ